MLSRVRRKPPGASSRIKFALDVSTTPAQLSIENVLARAESDISVAAFDFAGNDLLSTITEADSPEIVTNPNPGRVDTTFAAVVATASSGLVQDQLYILQYEIVATGDIDLFFTDSLGEFASLNLNRNIGVHTYRLRGRSGSQTDVVRVQGDITFGFISLKRAEWSVILPDRGPELVNTPDPAQLTFSGQPVSTLSAAPEVGVEYELSYTVDAVTGGGLFANTANGSPFTNGSLPATVGSHTVTVTVTAANTSAVMLKDGGGTLDVSDVSFRKILKGNDPLSVTLQAGDVRIPASVRTRSTGVLFCATHGSDKTGTGNEVSPFRNVNAAMAAAQPGDTIYLKPGSYDPFSITVSGAANDDRLTITTEPGYERQAIIDGNRVFAGGISCYGQDNIDILNLTIRDIRTNSAIQMGVGDNISVQGCQIHGIHRSAILCHGTEAVAYRDGPDTSIYMTNILFKGNDCYDCYRVGSGNEIISVAAGVEDIIIEDNDIHDSLQFGIDLKVGVQDAIVRRNRVWGVKEHGSYVDAAKKFARRIQIYDNLVWGLGFNHVTNQPMRGLNGIVLAREAEGDASQSELSEIDIYNNRVFGMLQQGFLAFAHIPNGGDQPDGTISDIRVRFNTFYDCGKDGVREEVRVADWTGGAYAANGVVNGFDVSGNIISRPGGGRVFGAQAMIDNPQFTYENNITDDPLFADADREVVIGEGFLPDITLPDFAIGTGSPAIDTTDAPTPFHVDAKGDLRGVSLVMGLNATPSQNVGFTVSNAASETITLNGTTSRNHLTFDASVWAVGTRVRGTVTKSNASDIVIIRVGSNIILPNDATSTDVADDRTNLVFEFDYELTELDDYFGFVTGSGDYQVEVTNFSVTEADAGTADAGSLEYAA